MMKRSVLLLLAVLLAVGFAGVVRLSEGGGANPYVQYSYRDRVVVSAPLLVFLAGGDRHLAANLEVMRVAATGIDSVGIDTLYLVRAQAEAARLHPCHEDNYYLANGLLSWSGAAEAGTEVLRQAMRCRFWDGVPPFLYAVNKSFFDHDIDEAVRALDLSAERWPANAALLRKMAVMLRVESFADLKLALAYLKQQREQSRDVALRQMLDKRVIRLEGLIALRDAQRLFEKQYGALSQLEQLVVKGFLVSLPEDPLRLGYELRDGQIVLRKMKIAGLEDAR